MSTKHDPLIRTAKHLGYSDSAVAKILGALGDNDGGAVHAVAHKLSPMAACAGDPARARCWELTRHMIVSVSGGTYNPQADEPIDRQKLDDSLRLSHKTDARFQIKANLKALGLLN